MSTPEISIIADNILKDNVVAFIGAGVSATAIDPYTGEEVQGLPLAGELTRILAREKTYIEENLSFSEACYLLKQKEGTQTLVNFLKDKLEEVKSPLPAHKLLADIPFDMYISMNFDELLEKALLDNNKLIRTVNQNSDVSILHKNEIPIVKPHGCFSNPKTIIASIDDEEVFLNKPDFYIVDAFLKAKLANKTILFLGFGLADNDFRELFRQIKNALGDFMPNSYAVKLYPTEFEKIYWKEEKVEILDRDIGAFLKELKDVMLQKKYYSDYDNSDNWFSHPFFSTLHHIQNLPTETQLIDAFLNNIISDVETNIRGLSETIKLTKEARDRVFKAKPNFHAFLKTINEVISSLDTIDTLEEAEDYLDNFKEKRESLSKKITLNAKKIINKGDNILIFSQSKRVYEFLSSVGKNLQKECNLYIAECRPKSPGKSFFQDAFEIVNNIQNNNYTITFFPDIIAGHLISEEKITKVILGAHAIFLDDKGKIDSYINTSGSLIISELCELYKIPLYVIAESAKEEEFDSSNNISLRQEVELNDEESVDVLKKYKQRGININILNVGYDLVVANSMTEYINEN